MTSPRPWRQLTGRTRLASDLATRRLSEESLPVIGDRGQIDV